MKTFQARYVSPHSDHPVSGVFEFESDARCGSKQNMTDARIKMLEIFGNDALSWTIKDIGHSLDNVAVDQEHVQLALDFREPKKVRKHHTFKRGGIV